MSRKSTEELLKLLKSSQHIQDLERYSQVLADNQSDSFHEYFIKMMIKKHLSAAEVIRASMIQRNYAYQLLSGLKKPGRDKILALCLGASFTLTETQRALTLAEEGLLYPRKARDSVFIFAIEKNLSVSQTNELLYEYHMDLL